MFSVVIPLYNKASYVSKAIESVLKQTFQDFELIIIDDGSTDSSIKEVNKYEDNRIKLICQPNSGVSAARNKGVKDAKFNYIAFLDADDWWSIHFLGEMAKLITQFPDAKLYGSSYYIVKYSINKLPSIGLPSDFEVGYIDYFSVYNRTFCVPFNCSFVVVEKDTFERANGFKESIKFGEDFDLWTRISFQKVAYINKPLAFSNQDVDSKNRALGLNKIWKKEEHITFNLADLEVNQQHNDSLHYLLDGLKVRSLINFYLKGIYHNDIDCILKNINWNNQPFLYRFIYTWPKWIVIVYFFARFRVSKMKKFFYSYT